MRRKIDGCGRAVHEAFQQRRAVDRDEDAAAPIYGTFAETIACIGAEPSAWGECDVVLSAQVLKADLPGIRCLPLQLVGHDQLIGSLNR